MCVCVKLENPSIISHNNNSIYIYPSNRSSFFWYNWLDNSNDHLLVAFVQFLPCLLAAASQKNRKNASEPVENSPCGYVRMYIYFQCCYHHHQVKHDEMIFTVDFLLIASSHHYHPYTQVNSVKSVSLYHTFTYLETCKYASTLYVDFFSTCTASSSFSSSSCSFSWWQGENGWGRVSTAYMHVWRVCIIYIYAWMTLQSGMPHRYHHHHYDHHTNMISAKMMMITLVLWNFRQVKWKVKVKWDLKALWWWLVFRCGAMRWWVMVASTATLHVCTYCVHTYITYIHTCLCVHVREVSREKKFKLYCFAHFWLDLACLSLYYTDLTLWVKSTRKKAP